MAPAHTDKHDYPAVLLVDEDPRQSEARVAWLQDQGFAVVSCHSSREALPKLTGEPFAVAVVCDNLPEQERQSLGRALRTHSPRTKIILDTPSDAGQWLRLIQAAAAEFVAESEPSNDRVRKAQDSMSRELRWSTTLDLMRILSANLAFVTRCQAGSSNRNQTDGFLDRIEAEDRVEFLAAVQTARESGAVVHHQFRIHAGDKSPRVLCARIQVVHGSGQDLPMVAFVAEDVTAHHHVERELLRHEALFQIAIQGSNEAMWDWPDVSSDVEWWSPRWYELLGYEVNEFEACYSKFKELLHPDDVEPMETNVRRHFEQHEPFDMEYRLRHKAGHYLWCRCRGQAVWDESGKPVRMAGTFHDISDRKRAEAARDAQLRHLRRMNRVNEIMAGTRDLDQMLAGLLTELLATFDCDRIFLMCPTEEEDDKFEIWLEKTKPEYPGATASNESLDVRIGESKLLGEHLIAARPMVHGEREVAERAPRVAERYQIKSMMVMPLRPKIGRPWLIGLHQCSHDRQWSEEDQHFLHEVGRRTEDSLTVMLAQERMLTSQQHFRELAEHIQEVFWIMDRDLSRILYVSPMFEKVWGISADEIYADPTAWSRVIVDEDRDRVLAVFEPDSLLTGAFDVEYRIRRPNGELRWIHDRAFAVTNDLGEVERFTGVAADITLRKLEEFKNEELEENLRQSQKMEAVGQLAAGVAHDVNNALTATLAHADMLEVSSESAEVQVAIDGIRRASKQASGVTQSLLTFSRKAVSKKTTQPFTPIVKEAVEMLRHMLPASIDVLENVPEVEEVWCRVNATQVQQVLINLAVNARDAMPAGGELTISLHSDQDDQGDRWAVLTIEDNGVGMTHEVRARMFEPFFTTKQRGAGTGLGLAIVHGILQEHGAPIQVHSVAEIGTRFTIKFPLCNPTPDAASPDAQEEAALGRGMLLLVEDQPELRRVLCSALRIKGYQVLEARDGIAAGKLFQVHESQLAAVILDIDLPKKGGLSVLRDIRKQRAEIPVVIISGLPNSQSSVEGEHTAFLSKPFRVHEIVQVLSDLAKGAQSE